MEKKRLRTITILFIKKIVIHKKRIKTKKTKQKKKKGNAIFYILNMYKKVDSFNIKYHDNVII